VRCVRVVGFINCATGFNRPSEVLHGFSDLMVDVFGDAGRHCRSAIGVAELYSDIPIEVEALFEVAS
jgi:enamine deaminase RidA (YjgF/YER057c/UK114 family)